MTLVRTVLVTGDVVIDHHIYRGDPGAPGYRVAPTTTMRRVAGGAALVFQLLEELGLQIAGPRPTAGQKQQRAFNAVFGLERTKLLESPEALCAYGVWEPFSDIQGKKAKVWRLADALGYGENSSTTTLPVDSDAIAKPADVLVLDDAQLGFRSSVAASAWPAFLNPKPSKAKKAPQPEWVVLKMAAPIACGDLWRSVCADQVKSKTVVLVSIDDIRREEVRVTSGISWERTAQDLVLELIRNPALSPLLECDHCIVAIGSEGAVLVDRMEPENHKFTLVFDPQTMEGDWAESEGIDGRVFGFMSCLTAAIAAQLATDDGEDAFERGIRSGMSAMRSLHRLGHGKITDPGPEIPMPELVKSMLASEDHFASAHIPIPDLQDSAAPRSWTILAGEPDVSQTPLYGIARQVAILGPKVALGGIPFQKFKSLFTVDRDEIEALRNLRQLVRDYDAQGDGDKPLSVAVFGAPGSGKSFSVKQLARAVLGDKVPILEFNLSQFADSELVGALHQVRDKVLEGVMPVVFWDEFDSGNYKWLQYLLAPMQDGQFQEGQIVHPIGKCVFVFAGGTSADFANFGPSKKGKAYDAFKLAKGPDFKSRLHGYLNVLGPNRRQLYDTASGDGIDDGTEVCFPVRRALLLRVFLGYFKDEFLRIDDGVLSALLEIDRYVHGARSMENVVRQMLSRGIPGSMRRSDLPPAEVMSMHAKYEDFMAIADRDLAFKSMAKKLAPAVHAYYRKLYPSEPTDKEFEELADHHKADNEAAAMRIPRVLSLGALYVVPKESKADGTTKATERVLKKKLELFAEAEHDGWMEHKLLNDWRYGPVKIEEQRIHNLLIAYKALADREREKDRNSVMSYPAILDSVGYKIATSNSS